MKTFFADDNKNGKRKQYLEKENIFLRMRRKRYLEKKTTIFAAERRNREGKGGKYFFQRKRNNGKEREENI